MLVAGDVEVPDKCPEDCRFRGSFGRHGQSAICGRCPVFCCSCNLGDDGQPFWLVTPEEYRRDWALEWQGFFRGGRTPELRLEKGEIEDETGELPERYRSAMPEDFFRKLTDAEEEAFRRWARDNFKAGDKVDPCWHPVVRGECYLIDREGGVEA